jgi:nucleoside-triphosphatase THEP1
MEDPREPPPAWFSLERLGGQQDVFAMSRSPGPPRLGCYGVDLAVLERLALPALEEANEHDPAIVDELGRWSSRRGRPGTRQAVSRG